MNSTQSASLSVANWDWQRLPARSLQDDAALAAHWDRLNAERGNLPFHSAAAMNAALRCFGSGVEALLVANQSGLPVAMFILAPDGALRWRTFQPSQLPLGAWVAQAGLPLAGLCRSLLRGPLGLCLVLSVTQIDPLVAERGEDAADLRHGDYIDTAWVDIAHGGFDPYWAARGKNLRQNLRKQRNRLGADGLSTTLRQIRDPAEMAEAVRRYGELESQGWKADRGTAIAADNAQGSFYSELLQNAAERGEALVFEYLIDGRTAAMNLCLVRGGVLVVLKTAYDQALPNALSPAFLLREEELQWLHGQQAIVRMEYFGRVMEWHTKLTDQQRTLYHLTAYRWPLLRRLAERRQAAAASLQQSARPADATAGQWPGYQSR